MKKKKMKKLNLSLEAEFYELLEEQSKNEHLMISSNAKRLLKKSLLANNIESKPLTPNESDL